MARIRGLTDRDRLQGCSTLCDSTTPLGETEMATIEAISGCYAVRAGCLRLEQKRLCPRTQTTTGALEEYRLSLRRWPLRYLQLHIRRCRRSSRRRQSSAQQQLQTPFHNVDWGPIITLNTPRQTFPKLSQLLYQGPDENGYRDVPHRRKYGQFNKVRQQETQAC